MSTLEQMVEQCDCCGNTLEIGQIGQCEGCAEQEVELSDEAGDPA